MNYWLVVGTIQNWHTAFEHGNIWGLRETQHNLWENLNEKDIILFYVTRPVGGIIGYGVVRTKFKQNKPLWPYELKERKVIWPLRFEFDVNFCLPPDKWASEKTASKELWPRAGFQLLSRNVAEELVSNMGTVEYAAKDNEPLLVSEPSVEFVSVAERMEKTPSTHDEVKEILVQIGKLQNYIAEKEYSFDIGKLDVVWRRVEQSVPTYVFEVQVGGDVYHALAEYACEDREHFIVITLDGASKIIEKKILKFIPNHALPSCSAECGHLIILVLRLLFEVYEIASTRSAAKLARQAYSEKGWHLWRPKL